MATVSVDIHFKLFNIFSASNIHEQVYNPEKKPDFKSAFPIVGAVMASNEWSSSDMSF